MHVMHHEHSVSNTHLSSSLALPPCPSASSHPFSVRAPAKREHTQTAPYRVPLNNAVNKAERRFLDALRVLRTRFKPSSKTLTRYKMGAQQFRNFERKKRSFKWSENTVPSPGSTSPSAARSSRDPPSQDRTACETHARDRSRTLFATKMTGSLSPFGKNTYSNE